MKNNKPTFSDEAIKESMERYKKEFNDWEDRIHKYIMSRDHSDNTPHTTGGIWANIKHEMEYKDLSEETKNELKRYTDFLLKEGYVDCDVYCEPPTAIGRFLDMRRKQLNKKK